MSPVDACPSCKGARYTIDRIQDRAFAKACPCNHHCTVCDGTGTAFIEKDGARYAHPCACRAIHRRVMLFNQARIPARYGSLTFADYKPENAAQAAAVDTAEATSRLYKANAPSRGFVVSGPVGTGKTHLLCAALRYLTLETGVTARYVEISFLFSEIRQGFAKNQSGLDAIMALVDVDVLAIDELGKGRGSPFEMDTLDELIARRYNGGRTTMVASNYALEVARPREKFTSFSNDTAKTRVESPGETPLRDRVGERIYSRLHEMCHFIQFPANTTDRRQLRQTS